MICNCLNNGNKLGVPKIKHVQGNVLRLAIPLTLRTVEKENGEITATDSPFIPSDAQPVMVEFSKAARRYAISAEMQGNVAYIEEKGKMPVGVYDIAVSCFDGDGNPYRFKQATTLQIVDLTAEAGIEPSIEYNTEVHILDAAVFIAVSGGGNGGSGDGKYHVLLTQAQYDALDTYDDNAIYMIYEPES